MSTYDDDDDYDDNDNLHHMPYHTYAGSQNVWISWTDVLWLEEEVYQQSCPCTGQLLCRTRRFFSSGDLDHRQYSLCLPTVGWSG